MNTEDTLAFLTAMCETGESARYGQRRREGVAPEFANLIAPQARRQLEDSRVLLAATKRALREFASTTLQGQVNDWIAVGRVEKVVTRFVGQLERAPERLENPDYSQVFVALENLEVEGASRIARTGVRLSEVPDGLMVDDRRLRDAVLELIVE